MKNEIIGRALSLAADFKTEVFAVKVENKEQKNLLCAIQARIESERRRAADRAAELRAIIADQRRSETVRSLAQKELAELESAKYGPTEAEREAFAATTAAAKQALADLHRSYAALREALTAARAELETIRKDSLGSTDLELMARWIESEQAAFEMLCR